MSAAIGPPSSGSSTTDSISVGAAGKVVGSKFVFAETRNRFVYPQDKTLTVYFEWEAPPGMHVPSGSWRQPDGRIATISSDVKIESQSS
jgi:hypothetical protein